MNSQVNYIVQASLLLIITAGAITFFNKMPFNSTGTEKNEAVYTTTLPKAVAISPSVSQGKIIFMGKCAACHSVFKRMTGPSLAQVIDNDQWSDRNKLYEWVRNPAAFAKKNLYARELIKQYDGMMMTAFPDLTNQEIDMILEYLSFVSSGKYY